MPEHARSPLSPLRPLSEALLFASNFLRHPNMLGSIIPSSRFLVDLVLEPIDWGRARVIVEYGPGVGTFTGEILRRLRSDAQLVAIEMNRDFVRFLQRTMPDPRLHVVHDSAAEVQAVLTRLALPAPRYIISGIPLGSMPDAVRTDIAVKSRAVRFSSTSPLPERSLRCSGPSAMCGAVSSDGISRRRSCSCARHGRHDRCTKDQRRVTGRPRLLERFQLTQHGGNELTYGWVDANA